MREVANLSNLQYMALLSQNYGEMGNQRLKNYWSNLALNSTFYLLLKVLYVFSVSTITCHSKRSFLYVKIQKLNQLW